MKLGLNGRFLATRVTGVQRFAREIAARLPRQTETTLFLPRGASSDEHIAIRNVVEGRLSGPLWEQLELPFAARRAGVDVLLHPANSAPRVGGPHVVVLHDVTPLTRPGDFTVSYRLWSAWAHSGAARRAAGVITVSNHSADEIVRELAIPRERITVVCQGVAPLDAPAGDHEVVDVRARHGLGHRYFLAVGPGDPRKGLAFLSAAYRRWRNAFPSRTDVSLVVVGEGWGHVHRATDEGDGLIMLGHVTDDELRALYTGAVAFLYPSQEEGFGRPPLEALACGTRVVVAPYATATEVLGDVAEVVPLEQTRWVEALTSVLEEPEDHRASRIAAGRRGAGAFTWERAVDRIVDVCRAVAGATRADPAPPMTGSG